MYLYKNQNSNKYGNSKKKLRILFLLELRSHKWFKYSKYSRGLVIFEWKDILGKFFKVTFFKIHFALYDEGFAYLLHCSKNACINYVKNYVKTIATFNSISYLRGLMKRKF